jgi:hypothetical protein
LAYRFTYETNKEIICAPIYNERFYGWPIPYKEQVDHSDKVAFVMSNTYGTKYSSDKFIQTMNEYGLDYQQVVFEPYIVYHEFEYEPAVGEKNLPPDNFEISTNIDEVDVFRLLDGEVMTPWGMQQAQETGQEIDIEFEQKQFVQKIELVHPVKNSYPAATVRIFGKRDNKWSALTDHIDFQGDKLRYENKHPIFGEFSQAIRFEPLWLEAVRIELTAPVDNQPWTLSEIRLGVQTGH